MVHTRPVTHVQHIWISIKVDLFASRSRKCIVFSGILFNFFIYFYLEIFQFLFYLFINMPLIMKKVIWVVHLSFLRIIDILSKFSNVIDCGTNHTSCRHVLAECRIPIKLTLGGYLWIIKCSLLGFGHWTIKLSAHLLNIGVSILYLLAAMLQSCSVTFGRSIQF